MMTDEPAGIAAEQVAYWRAQGVLAKEAAGLLRPDGKSIKTSWVAVESMVIRAWRGMQ
jgi:hypothetical protein